MMGANELPYLLPTAEQFYSAFPNRAQDVYELDYTTDAGMEALKAHLASGDLATMSMILYENFTHYPADTPGINNGVFEKFCNTFTYIYNERLFSPYD